MSTRAQAQEFWDEHTGLATRPDQWDDESGLVEVTMSMADIKVIREALGRLFVQRKRGRVQVLHAERSLAEVRVKG